MGEILLLTVENAVQLSEDVLITPFLLADNFEFDLDWITKIKIVKPDHQILEKRLNSESLLMLQHLCTYSQLQILKKMKSPLVLIFGLRVFRENYSFFRSSWAFRVSNNSLALWWCVFASGSEAGRWRLRISCRRASS